MSNGEHELRVGASGDAVRDLHSALVAGGFEVPKAEVDDGVFGPGTREALVRAQAASGLDETGVINPATIGALAGTVVVDPQRPPVAGPQQPPVDRPGDTAPAGPYHVFGTVASPDRAGVNGLLVVVVDRNVGQDDDPVGRASTDARGRYDLNVSIPSVEKGTKESPDLQTRVYADTTFLGESIVRYDASQEERLDVLLPAGLAGLPSEHDSLTTAIAAHYDGPLDQLRESKGRADVTYLANKTGWDARAVALAALAHGFSNNGSNEENGGIHPAFYYALFRAGLPANPDTLYRAHPDTVTGVWKQAIGQGVIPASLDREIDGAAEAFRSAGAQHLLDARPVTGLSTLRQLLTPALGEDPARQQQFADIHAQYRNEPDKLWSVVKETFGPEIETRLRLDGQLGFLTLDNAPLIASLHDKEGQSPISSTYDLAFRGYHRAEKWAGLIDGNVPDQIPGDTVEERSANYADLLAAQVRFSFPTAVVADLAGSALPIQGGDDVRKGVQAFLTDNAQSFEIGMHPVGQFIARNKLDVSEPVTQELTRIQRVYQITPDDDSMTALLESDLDSAHRVVRFTEQEFIDGFHAMLGGEDLARLTYAKAQKVHNAVLNIALTYLMARVAPGIGVRSPAQVLDPGPGDGVSADVIAYPTLEGLFGSMDFCACDHCRSNLSPAAYHVDLLDFIDRDDDVWTTYLTHWHSDHGGAPYPFADAAAWNAYQAAWTADHPAQPVPNTEITPFEVLAERRPDLQHLLLTCENTNTALPYIDIVNETLEYFVANGVSLDGYKGHDNDGSIPSEELLASPQFVDDIAYAALKDAKFPPPLPFDLALETMRAYFDHFEVPLDDAMEALRVDDAVERSAPVAYAWRDILMEQLRLSRVEYALLTDRTIGLAELYGYPSAMSDGDVIAALTKVKSFTRRVGITYKELVDLLGARFVNPSADLIPKLERLGVDFATLKALKTGAMTDGAFDALLPDGLDQAEYGGDVKAWVKDDANYARIMSLIMISNPTDGGSLCDADALELRYSDPDNAQNTIHAIDAVRLLRFIRLWRKLDWTVQQLDAAIAALSPGVAADLEALDNAFLSLLPRLGIVGAVNDSLNLKPTDLPGLLACWSPIDAYGPDSLFRKMFGIAVTKQDPAFADDGFGNVLTDGGQKLLAHAETLRAGFGVTSDELTALVGALGYDENTPLRLDTISELYRRGWLARKLRLSVRELLLLVSLTGLDAFAMPDPPNPPILRLAELVQAMHTAGLKSAQALYLVWNQDLSGKSVPEPRQLQDLARTLRAGYAGIESEFAVVDDPNGDVARARMALVYGAEATDFFFGLLGETLLVDVPYSHGEPVLEQSILDAAPGRVGYDDFRKRLSYTGVMTDTARDALKAAADATPAFDTAVDALYAANQAAVGPFFTRYPELLPLYTAYAASTDPPATKRTALLAAFVPELKRRRKEQQALSLVTSAAQTDGSFAFAVLDDVTVLHAADDSAKPALADLTGIEAGGLAAEFYFADTATGTADDTSAVVPAIDYSVGELPANPTPGAPISVRWTGSVEPAESTFYNIRIRTDAGAAATLRLSGADVPLTQDGSVWTNTTPISLSAGTLVELAVTVEKVKDVAVLEWETAGHGWAAVPSERLYSATTLDLLDQTYVRFLKLVSLAFALALTADELAFLAADPDLAISGHGWGNALGAPDAPTEHALLDVLTGLLDFAFLKASLSPDDDRVLGVLREPAATLPNGDSLLLTLTGWETGSLDALLTRFGKVRADLTHVVVLRRVFDAYIQLSAFGIGAAALIAATTNDPDLDTARSFQSALRARYDEADLLSVLQPINDGLRSQQRDALVAYVLTKLGESPDTAQIDTPDKLFEFFLMDVEMDPCMQTSRIRHALSSVQLFIDRCLMNLEPRVSPVTLDSEKWKWMRRYRVWEANRKVFMWPENWLEPELRDDQSSFFKAAMSELLQSDITEDTAAVALLNYLAKLEEVAKLEPCGLYFVENDPGTSDDVVHVVGRTAGAHRKYFYRCRTGGFWTPWEQIPVDIEDNPVVPVVWRNRLFVFWLKVLGLPPIDPNAPNAQPSASGSQDELAHVHLNTVKSEAASEAKQKTKVTIRAALCWSEFYNGKWQQPKTSDVNRPTVLGDFDAAGDNAFDRSALYLSTTHRVDGGLHVWINGQGGSSFVLYNTHSAPVRSEDLPLDLSELFLLGPSRYLDTSSDTFTAYYDDQTWFDFGFPDPLLKTRPILKNPLRDLTVPPRQPLDDVWDAPFLYEDTKNVFYVTTSERLVTVWDFVGFGPADPAPWVIDIPPIVLQRPPFGKLIDPGGPVIAGPDFGVVDPLPVEHFLSEDVNIRNAIGSGATVRFGGATFGPTGAVMEVEE